MAGGPQYACGTPELVLLGYCRPRAIPYFPSPERRVLSLSSLLSPALFLSASKVPGGSGWLRVGVLRRAAGVHLRRCSKGYRAYTANESELGEFCEDFYQAKVLVGGLQTVRPCACMRDHRSLMRVHAPLKAAPHIATSGFHWTRRHRHSRHVPTLPPRHAWGQSASSALLALCS